MTSVKELVQIGNALIVERYQRGYGWTGWLKKWDKSAQKNLLNHLKRVA